MNPKQSRYLNEKDQRNLDAALHCLCVMWGVTNKGTVLAYNGVPCAVVVFKRRFTRAVEHLSYVIDTNTLKDGLATARTYGVPCFLVIEWNDGIKWIHAAPFEQDIPLSDFKPLLNHQPMFNTMIGR